MVAKTLNQLVSLPCMVNSLPVNEIDEEIHSCNGLALLSSKLHDLYIITVSVGNFDTTAKDRNSKVEIIFKVSGQLYKTSAQKIVQCKSCDFEKQLKMVFQPQHQWKLSYEKNESDEYDISHLSTFCLYCIKRQAVDSRILNAMSSEAVTLSTDKVWSGSTVTTISYPFGPDAMEIFTGAASTGIVSNICEVEQGSLFMIDARCLPGSEGGGVYSVDPLSGMKNLIGVIVSPMCWKTQELVGVSICCTLQHVLCTLRQSLLPQFCELQEYFNSTRIGPSILPRVNQHSPVVVRIETEGIWGSGIVCGARLHGKMCQLIVCTCRHVVERKLLSDNVRLNVKIQGINKRYTSRILFATDENAVYDFALLSAYVDSEDVDEAVAHLNRRIVCNGSDTYGIAASFAGHVIEGITVFTKGYGLFDSTCDVGPTFSQGVISNVVRHAGQDVLIHSTCLVHKGTSGGALVCQKTGKLIGITVNHVKDEEANISYPDVNFSIPCAVFMPALHEFLKTGDLTPFNSLNRCHDEVARIWSLTPQTDLRDANKPLPSKL